MFEGNIFFPLTGTPISNKDWSKMRFADCEPVPFAVAILMVKSLAMVSIVCVSLEFAVLSTDSPATWGFAHTL